MDCCYDRVFSFVDGRLTMIAEGTWGAWGKREFDADGNIIDTYSWNGTEMSEAEYETSLEAVCNRSTAGSYTWPGKPINLLILILFYDGIQECP